MNTETRSFNLAIDGGLILILLTALLYASGTAYHHGYLATWGLEKTLFTKTFHQTLYSGLLVWFNLGFKVIIPLVLTGIVLFGVSIVIFTLLTESFWLKRQFVKVLKKFRGKKNKSRTKIDEILAVKYSAIFFSITIFTFLFMLILLTVLAYFEKQGIENSKEYQSKILSKDSKIKKQTIKAKYKKNTETYSIIDCSQSMCAVVKFGSEIQYFMDLRTFTILIEK